MKNEQLPESIGTVKASVLIEAINSYKKHFEDLEDFEISFEYIIGSFFPDVLDNILSYVKDERTKAYIEGYHDARVWKRKRNETD